MSPLHLLAPCKRCRRSDKLSEDDGAFPVDELYVPRSRKQQTPKLLSLVRGRWRLFLNSSKSHQSKTIDLVGYLFPEDEGDDEPLLKEKRAVVALPEREERGDIQWSLPLGISPGTEILCTHK